MPPPKPGLLDTLPAILRDHYENDFHSADTAFLNGRLAVTSNTREKYWKHWAGYVQPLGMDPFLPQNTPHHHVVRLLTGFAARVRTGFYGRGKQITASAVTRVIMAIGQTIALARGVNPTKVPGSDKLLPRLSQMIDGWRKADPPTVKKLPVEVDIPEFIATLGTLPDATALDQAIGDLTLVAFYYLLRVGEYTSKASKAYTKQTIQFRLCDITFFKNNSAGRLRQLSRLAPILDILATNSATLRLENQKNGW